MQQNTTVAYLLPWILLLVVFASGNTTYRIKINPVNNVIGNVIIMAAMCGLMASTRSNGQSFWNFPPKKFSRSC